MRKAIVLNSKDNVATAVVKLEEKQSVLVTVPGAGEVSVEVRQEIPYGHKIALEKIEKGQSIMKYGEEIGVAGEEIPRGAHVHIQNVESKRGRGDK